MYSSVKVDVSSYRGMIGSLLYLTASKHDIMYATCLCARFQADPRDIHLVDVKWILRYLKGTPNLGIWYPRDIHLVDTYCTSICISISPKLVGGDQQANF